MPSFQEMNKHFQDKRENYNNNNPSLIGRQIREMSKMGINETFTHNTTYRVGMIYDRNLNPIKEMEFKFLKTKTYTMEKDAVEYMVMFRPGVNPEIDFNTSDDNKRRVGFYLDIWDENTNLVEKWLMIGKDTSEFDKYNVLKCNWEFEWIDKERVYHKVLGCVRDRNNYNSGVWSRDGLTTVENQTAFIVPTTDDTNTIDYDVRFMITDNTIHPKTYRATKLMDTFPLGTIKVTLGQSHYNEHTDLCEKVKLEEFGDTEETMHMICDYYKSSLPPIAPNKEDIEWKLESTSDRIRVGETVQINATNNGTTSTYCEWNIFVDGTKYEFDELSAYFDITPSIPYNGTTGVYTDTISITVKEDIMIGYIIKIAIFDSSSINYDYIEMEVVDG